MLGMLLVDVLIAVIGSLLSYVEVMNLRNIYGADYVPPIGFALMRILVVTLVVLTGIAYFLYRKMEFEFVQPVRRLSEMARRIAEGELDFQVEYSGEHNLELKSLYSDFDYMRKRLLDNALEKLESEEQNRLFISNIAHDLRTPVTTIRGYSEGLLDGIAATPEKRDRYLLTIKNKSMELDRLLNELSFYTKVSQSSISYNFVRLDLTEYFEDCRLELEPELAIRNFDLRIESGEESLWVMADPEQLKRVTGNIITNAIKYNDKDKGLLEIEILSQGDMAEIIFRDNGPGVEEENLERIFDRFYRTDKSRSTATGGSGIGLSIVKKVTEDHGGRVWARNSDKGGLEIHMELKKYEKDTDN